MKFVKTYEAVKRFLADLKVSKSPKTVRAYQTALTVLVDAIGADTPASDIGPNIVPQFVRWLDENKSLSPATLGLYLTALSKFYEWLVLEGIATNEMLHFRKWCNVFKKPEKRKMPRLPREDLVQALFRYVREKPEPDNPDDRLRHLRDLAILETLRCTGCRVEEIAKLRNGDLDISPAAMRATVEGKGGKTRTVFWDREGQVAVQKYLAAKGNTLPEEPLFQRHDRRERGKRKPISTNTIRQILNNYVRIVTYDPHNPARREHITPHQFRHRFATLALQNSQNLAIVQDLLGHASTDTTRIYTQLTEQELHQAYETIQL